MRREHLLNLAMGLALLAGLQWISLYSFLLFHSLAEMFSVAVAWSTFFLAWNARRQMERGHLVFLGTAFLAMGLVDMLHTLAYKGMGVFPEQGANLPTQLWIAGRYIQAGAFLALPFTLRRRLNDWTQAALIALATALLLGAVFSGRFPDCFVEGSGLTRFKIASEYAICLALAAASILLWRRRDQFAPRVIRFILGSLALTVASELAFTFYVDVYGLSNLLGHFFKIVACVFLYKAIVETGLTRPYDLLFRDLAQSREALRRSEAGLKTAQAMARVGSFERDLATGAGRWSDEFYRLLGYEPGQVDNSLELFKSHIHADDLDRFELAFHKAIESGDPIDMEFRYRPLGQEIRHAHHKAVLQRDAQGNPMLLQGTFQDITERKQAERLREDVEHMTRHDLRSPVNAIISGARLLREPDIREDQRRLFLGEMEAAGFRMLGMINNSLNLLSMEMGNYTPQLEPVDLCRALRHIAAEAASWKQDATIVLRLDGKALEQDATFLVLGEELLCHTLLSNLARNAVEASPPGEQVTIDLVPGLAPEVRIHNQGAVPPDVRERFFEKYATSGKRYGTGLGTYSAKLMAQTMGGGVRMETSEAEGTTLIVRLPRA